MRLIFSLLIFFLTQSFSDTFKKVTLQLEWKHQFEFAGFYIAKEKGYYKNIGLDVEFKEYELGIDISDDVANGKSTFGVNYPIAILDKSIGKDIVLLSSILQTSPHVIATLESSGIKTLNDFKNVSLMTETNTKNSVHFASMFQSKNISFDNIKKVPHSFNLDDFIDKKVDAITMFISNEPYLLNQKGIKYKLWDPKDYGFDFYDLILITSSKLAKDDPSLVENFKKASLEGWKYAFENIEETSEIILEKYNTQNKTKEHLIYEGQMLKNMAYYKTNELGIIDEIKVQRIIDIYNVLGLIKNKIDAKSLIFKKEFLTKEEHEYLDNKNPIRICIDSNWMPFEAKDKNGNYIGISSDYFKLFSQMLNVEFSVVDTNNWVESLEFARQRKCDILPLTMKTNQREEYMNFTSSYLKVPLVIATNINAPFIENLELLKYKKIAIPKGHAFIEILRNKYPDLNIIEVENINEGLEKVKDNDVFGYIGTLPSIGYLFQHEYNGELKIAGKFDEQWELGVAVRNDDLILLNIMQKAVDNLDSKQQQAILNNWISIKYEKGLDYNFILKFVFSSLMILFIFIYWNRVLHNSKKQLEFVNKENKKHLDVINKNILMSTCDKEGNITYVTEALCNLTGYEKAELLGKKHNVFRHKDMASSIFDELWETISQSKTWHGEIKNLNKDGSFYWADVIVTPNFDDNSNLIGYSAVRQNITDRKVLEEISITDSLTKVFNRMYLDKTFELEIERAKRYSNEFSLIMIDVDNFKKINDSYGHNTGDIILKEVSNLIKQNIRSSDKLGRWGGEEFLIICPETNSKNAQIIAENLRKLISNYKFYNIQNLTCSFGVTEFTLDDEKIEIFNRVDRGLYLAKENGRNKVIVL